MSVRCLRKGTTWLHVRSNRVIHRGQRVFGQKHVLLTGGAVPGRLGHNWQFKIWDIWAGPYVIRLEHWRDSDA